MFRQSHQRSDCTRILRLPKDRLAEANAFPRSTMDTRMRELKCLSATGQLGHGIIADAFRRGVARKPDVIGADMGSTDIGPYYLGSGNTESSVDMIDRDLELVLVAG